MAVWNTAVASAAGATVLVMMDTIVDNERFTPRDDVGRDVIDALRSARDDIHAWLAWVESQVREGARAR